MLDDIEHTDFEQRRALQQFHDAVNNGVVETIADDLFIRQIKSPSFIKMMSLICIFNNHSDEKYFTEIDLFVCGAVKRRDSEMWHYLADEMYEPDSQLTNTRFIDKLRLISEGKAEPSFKLV